MTHEFDVVLVGASGFTGKLLAEWFYRQAPKDIKWAIAGRSSSKLEACSSSLEEVDTTRSKPAILVVDTLNDEQCANLVKKTKVVITTVGPYSKLGEPLLRACAHAGTHYCDLTGEIPFVKLMMQKYESVAKASGSVIICCAGFDSVPVDIVNFVVARYIRKKYNSGTRNARTIITKVKGAVSGGTLASVFALLDVFSLKQISAAHAPWSISTRKGSSLQKNIPHVTWDADVKMYCGSWLGDSVDRSVAARSWSLLHYGEGWTTYGYLGFSAWYRAYAYLFTLYLGTLLIGLSPVRFLLKRYVIQPGSGPSRSQMDKGCLELQGIGESDDQIRHKVKATLKIPHADPGYKGTAAILASVGLVLALDLETTEAGSHGGGFWTPASLGDSLITRLADAGITVQVLDL